MKRINWLPAVVVAILLCPSIVAGSGDVTLVTSKPAYVVGEEVLFTLHNGSDQTTTLPQWPGWIIWSKEGAFVGGCVVNPIEVDLWPGGTFDYSWNQLDCYEVQVPPGSYRIEVDYWPSETTLETWFNVGLPTAIEPATWSRIKILFGREHR